MTSYPTAQSRRLHYSVGMTMGYGPSSAGNADLEIRHSRRARCEDRKDPRRQGHRPAEPALHGYAQNQVSCEIVQLACELITWTQMLAFDGAARRWEPKRLRLRIFAVAGRIVRGGRRLRLRLTRHWP